MHVSTRPLASRLRRISVLLAVLPLAGSAVSLTAVAPRPAMAKEDLKPEPAAASRLTGVSLPSGAVRVADVGPVAELTGILRTVAKQGNFVLGETETLLWGGPEHNSDRAARVKETLVESLKKARFKYELAGEQQTEQGYQSLFAAGQEGKDVAVLGFWMANDSFLMLTWGKITQGEAGQAEAAPEKPSRREIVTPAADSQAPVARDGRFPAHLAGKWGFTSISGTTYWDKTTGAYLGSGTGGSQTYTFDGKGGYKMFNYIKANTYGWQLETLTWEEGTVTVEGDRIALRPTSGKYKVMDNRVAKNNYERPMRDDEIKKNAKSYFWSMGTDSRTGKPALMMGSERGKLVQYRRPDGE